MKPPTILRPDGWHPLARWTRSPNYDSRPANTDPRLIVVHSISLPRRCYGNGLIDRFFINRLDTTVDPSLRSIQGLRVSAHFVLSRTGRLSQYVSCRQRAWHAGKSSYRGQSDCNNFSIGIELEGCEDEAYTGEQYLALARLCADLIASYPTLDARAVVGHQHIAPERKTDPGRIFDWSFFFNLLSRSPE